MFFFGLFSTHLPFIIVGLAYFASVAFASVHYANRPDNSDADPFEQNTLAFNDPGIQDHASTYQFVELAINADFAVIPDSRNGLIPWVIIQTFVYQEPVAQGSYKRQYFTRPPPEIS